MKPVEVSAVLSSPKAEGGPLLALTLLKMWVLL